MNTIHRILLIGLVSLGATACSDAYFDKYPTDSMQMETYLKNDSEVQNVLLDSYYYLRSISSAVIQVNSLATDEAYDNKRNNSTDHISLNEASWDATLGITSSIWTYCYNMINRCNNVLDNLSNVSTANKAQYEGEASAMRAYAYFTLVRLFGPVPLTKNVIANYSDLYNYDRESVDNVYATIKDDLAKAIKDLPEKYSAQDMQGRATKIAAYTMLADVQMTLGDFASAKTTLDNVIKYSEAHPSALGLETKEADVFDSANANGKEIIFAAQFNNGATIIANGLMGQCIPNVVPTTQPSYVYPSGVKSTISTSAGSGVTLMTWELWNKLRENPADARFTDLSYCGTYDAQAISIPSAEVPSFEAADGSFYAYAPMSMKYYDTHNEGLTVCRSSCDNIIYRYAGVLLMYAECLNETNATGQAIGYLNIVRGRAGALPTAATSQAQVRLAIEDENLLELNFEGHRWYNLVRTGRINTVMEEHFNHRTPGLAPLLQANDNGMVINNATDTKGVAIVWKWKDHEKAPVLFPIPYDQLQLSSSWDQNELY